MKAYYRIFEENQDGEPLTLFHGVNGSRKLPLDTVLEAKVAPCIDGTGGTEYLSGFHVLRTKEDVRKHLGRGFRKAKRRVICRVWADEVWDKGHSRAGVVLARKMLIRTEDWLAREAA